MNSLWEKFYSSKTNNEETAFYCTLKGLMQISKMNKMEAINYLKKNGVPLEHKGWYEVILNKDTGGQE